MTAALEGVKPGDKLICGHSRGSGSDVYVVERLTKTLAVCRGGASFNLNNGKMRGTDSWSSRWARIPTADDLARIEMNIRVYRVERKLEKIRLSARTVEQAEALITAVEQEKSEATHAQ